MIRLLFLVIAGCCSVTSAFCPPIYARLQWSARPPKGFVNFTLPVANIIVHHTVMGDGNCTTFGGCVRVMKEMQNFHMDDRGWDDIGYSFAIGGEGSIFEGRGWNRVGAHAPGYNDKSVGISLIGDFTTKLPSAIQISVAKSLIACGIERGYITSSYALYGHRDVSATACPGDLFYEELSTWPQKQTPSPLELD